MSRSIKVIIAKKVLSDLLKLYEILVEPGVAIKKFEVIKPILDRLMLTARHLPRCKELTDLITSALLEISTVSGDVTMIDYRNSLSIIGDAIEELCRISDTYYEVDSFSSLESRL